jgi:phosphoglucomutase
MSIISHPATGFPVGDPDFEPLNAASLPSRAEIDGAISTLILSASGWRKVFASGGDEESDTPSVSKADLVLAGAAALAYAGLVAKRRPDLAKASILVGIDSRPTGPALADIMIRVFLGLGLEPRYLFIVAAPEIMAYAQASAAEGCAGFCYISASHNPRGHNGLKFGLGSGGVLGSADSAELIASYKELLADPAIAAKVLSTMAKADRRAVATAFTGCSAWKRRSVSAYTLFAREVISGSSELEEQDRLLDAMAETAQGRKLGVVAELNGSARCLSIDRDFLEGLGVSFRAVNDKPRAFAHRIVPEGESLDQAIRELEAANAEDPAFVAGYVPDCDGDRGNLVVATGSGKARPVEAQEVFALACVAELALLVREGKLSYGPGGAASQKAAIVVNDATSMRIEAIGRAFGVEVRRAETGEANIVGLAQSLRSQGYIVRILGEGSNGGNITHPSRVRDPLATLGALLKLLLIRGEKGLYPIWLARSGRADAAAKAASASADYSVDDILSSLPAYATTSVFEPRAALRVKSADQPALKARYATLFLREWEEKKAEFQKRYGIVSWKALATKGQAEEELGTEATGADFAASGRGGLRIVFADPAGKSRAFLWMRGSGTESVFRVMADVEGGKPEDEEYFLAWHVSLVRRADEG